MYFSLYRCSSWMQTPQQQSHSCDFTNWKIHEPEEATKTICHLSRPISNTFVGNIYQLLCLCDIPWLMYCRFLQINHSVSKCLTFTIAWHTCAVLQCVAFADLVLILCIGYWTKHVGGVKTFTRTDSPQFGSKMSFTCTVCILYHIVASMYAESCFMLLKIFYWFSVIYSFFPFCIAGEFGKLLCPMLCAFFASSISAKRKRWFNDCFSCFYLFYTIKFIICAIKMCKIQCVWSFNGVPPLLFLLIYLYILYKTCVWYVYNSYIYSYRPMFAHSEPMNMILKHKAEGYSLQKLFLGVLEAVHWRHLQAVIVLQR